MDIAVVIPTRNEDMLPYTVGRVLATRGGASVHVVVVDDGSDRHWSLPSMPPGCKLTYDPLKTPTGLCYCRDRGIAQAESETVLVIDAHTNLYRDGAYPRHWATWLPKWSAANPTGVGCAICQHCRPEDMTLGPDKARYWGATCKLLSQDSYGRHWAVSVCWDGRAKAQAEAGLPGEIPCPLGGHYCLSRRHYMETLGRPWRTMRGWGSAEPSLALHNWLCGGTSYLLPVEMGHMFRTRNGDPRDNVPYVTDSWTILYNQMRLAQLVAEGTPWHERFARWLRSNPEHRFNVHDQRAAASALACPTAQADIAQLRARHVRTFEAWIEAYQPEVEHP